MPIGEEEELLVLADHDAAFLDSPGPDYRIIGLVQPDIDDVYGIAPQPFETTGQLQRELVVDEESQATRMTA